MIWEWIKFFVLAVGFWTIGLFLFVTLWCLLHKINDARAERENRDRIDERFWG